MSKVENKIASAISRREFLSVTAAASGAAILAGCAPAATAAPTAAPIVAAVEPTKTVSDETYVWLGAVTAIAFWIDGQTGFYGACDALGVKGEYLGPVEYDAVAQLENPGRIDRPQARRHHDLPGRRPVPERAAPARHGRGHPGRSWSTTTSTIRRPATALSAPTTSRSA